VLQSSDAWFALLLLAASCAALPLASSKAFERCLRVIDTIASRPALAIALCAALSFFGSMAVAITVMWPVPRVHDEFSYLLAADTFAQGRLSNPTHPLWQHFESFHIFHQPSYASKYPPAQGAMLALGIVLAGEPLVGVWLSGALMCGAICWLLYAVVSERWALLGGLAATIQIGIATKWTQTYWGGAIAAAGGALVLGGAVRLVEHARPRDAVVLASGLIVLASSRPFEGAIASVAAMLYVLYALVENRSRVLTALRPALVPVVAFAFAMAAYNHTVVGHWWLPPYVHHDLSYGVPSTVSFLSSRPPNELRHEEMRRFYGRETLAPALAPASVPAPAAEREVFVDEESVVAPSTALEPANLRMLNDFFLGRAMLLPFLLGLVAAVPRREGRMLFATMVLGLVTLLGLRYFHLHYLAPATGAVFAVVTLGLERFDAWQPKGRRLGTAICIATLAAVLFGLTQEVRRLPDIHTAWGYDFTGPRRAETVRMLRASPGRDLVIVLYGPNHVLHHEWVYNDADIDASEIVWARDMGPGENQRLLEYFRDRRAWLYREGFAEGEDGLAPYP
jgi:hypothetical protein